MGKVICVGVGPGDPDLMSVKSDRLIRTARHLAFFRKKGRAGQARRITASMLACDVTEYPMEYPVTTELPFDSPAYKHAMRDFYDHWADRLYALAQHDDVVVLCEGDPFFYGSYIHLFKRLEGRVEQEIIPSIMGMTGCWHALGQPMTQGDDVMTILMGTLSESELAHHIQHAQALVIMKTGKNLPKISRALKTHHRLDEAWLIEYGTMPQETITPLKDADVSACPYFATVIICGKGRAL